MQPDFIHPSGPHGGDHGVHPTTRRHFLRNCTAGVGAMALTELLATDGLAGAPARTGPGQTAPGHAVPRARNVIFLFMAGGPSQFEMFEDKPRLREFHGQAPPPSLMEGRRFAFLKGDETLLGAKPEFERAGQCGMPISELLPYHKTIADEVTWLRGMTTDVFNHGPAKLFMNSGFQAPGRPSMGSWLLYGLGSESADLPGFVVLQSGNRGPRAGNALWSSGFLPSSYQGVPFRGQGDPILNLRNPDGFDTDTQAHFLDGVQGLNRLRHDTVADPEIMTRIKAYEMAFRMQASAPELMDIAGESQATLDLYGVKPGQASFANNCLLARRLIERGTRFVQLYHTDWDHHGGRGEDLNVDHPRLCRETDQASAALVLDLKQRGLLEDTIVIWGGEFGRTPMGEVRATVGRDHHVDAFTMWIAGGGFKAGYIHGETDELGFGVVDGKVHVHDFHATLLHQLGINHERLTYRFQGRDFRLTDVHGHIVREVIA